MPTTRVTHAAKATSDLSNAAELQATTAATRLAAVAEKLSVPVTADVAAAVTFLIELARAAAGEAIVSDAAYHARITEHAAPAAHRDDSVHDLLDFVRGLRASFVHAYGRDVAAAVFPAGDTPRDGGKLVTYAGQVAKTLGRPGATFTPLPNAPSVIDVPATVAKLVALAAAADAEVKAVSVHVAATHAARQEREDAYAMLHDLHQGLQQVMLGLLEAGGAHDLADHLVEHHHLSHAKAAAAADETPPAAAPAPPAPAKG